MKILYAIQGTGNGHISRARDIIPILQKKGELDILISGIQADVSLPYEVKYKFKGLSFIFGKNGGIDLLSTYKKSNLRNLFKEIRQLPIKQYDLVISDFEPVSAWAAKKNNIPCIGLSHQAAVINKKSPKPKNADMIGKMVLKKYAPVTLAYGFHFKKYDENIFTPVIRTQIREAKTKKLGHYTVYLPAYSDEKILKVLGEIKGVRWEVFSKHTKKEYTKNNIRITPIDNDKFVNSLLCCAGILCGAGFETPAEALFLKKKLMVIPMKGQFEQQCNAAALKELGVPVIKSLKKKHLEKIVDWVGSSQQITVDYKDQTSEVVDMIMEKFKKIKKSPLVKLGSKVNSYKKLKEKSFGKIIGGLSKG